ncbi:hypothetical protein [Aestuariivirga sp.]|jgi:hypothetical protein|uniref:hypothetical protein n=1 Tax=Aestuariivirga sp. TaxID=2650926 RepID=UPI0037841CC3
MILKPTLAAMLASGLIVPETPKLVLPKPAIVKAENLEFSKHMLLGMPLTMAMLPGKASAARTVTYRGSAAITGSSTTKTYTNAPIGTAASNRLVVLVVTIPYTTLSTGATVAGNAMTLVSANPVSGRGVYIYGLVVTTGTTATIVNTTAASVGAYPMFVYTVSLGSTSATPSNTKSFNVSSTTAASFPAITVPNGGIYIAAAISGGSGASNLVWTGATENAELGAILGRAGVASGNTVGSVTVSVSGLSTSGAGGAVAAW